MSARFAAADYANAMRALMPRGAVWPLSSDSVQGDTLAGLAPTMERIDAAAVALLVGAFPATADELLPEWEASLGLPDPVIGAGPTDDQRRAQVVARLVGAGGQSRQRFIDFAATLGFTITITNYAPLRAGHFNAGDAAYGTAWADAWGIHVAANAGGLTADQLKAAIDEIRPAETTTILI